MHKLDTIFPIKGRGDMRRRRALFLKQALHTVAKIRIRRKETVRIGVGELLVSFDLHLTVRVSSLDKPVQMVVN